MSNVLLGRSGFNYVFQCATRIIHMRIHVIQKNENNFKNNHHIIVTACVTQDNLNKAALVVFAMVPRQKWYTTRRIYAKFLK